MEKITKGDYLQRMGINPDEIRIVFWSMLYIFSLFVAYYLLRPVRDELGVDSGVKNLPWLFSGTLIAMLVVNPVFSWSVKHWSRLTFISRCYRFFLFQLLLFALLLTPYFSDYRVWIGRAFFIWLSVFNLFVVSVFWSFIVDIFNAERGKRLFGFMAAGATMGGMSGSALTLLLVNRLGQHDLMLIAAVMLELSVRAARQAGAALSGIQNPEKNNVSSSPIGGSVYAGVLHTFKSPYLAGIALFIMLYSVTSTFLYLEQASIAADNFADRASRTAFFASVDLWVNVLTLAVQLLLTSSVLRWFGVSLTLAILPAITLLGFSFLLTLPGLIVFVVVQVLRRVTNFAFARPGRELLFTAASPEDRYKAKNFIDTVIYRLGDQIGSWSYSGLMTMGSSGNILTFIAIPLSAIWLILALWLGHRQQQLQPE